MSDSTSLGKLVPGFDFLQGLVKNAGAALPGIGNWIAPTLNPEELEKRIEELRTVQFWLEQNARMLAATIQALEVQRMTLSTLKSMNVSVEAMRDSMTLRPPAAKAPASAFAAAAPAPAPAAKDSPARGKPKAKVANGAAAQGVVDPMQWWGALTNQFTQLAAQAMKDMVKDGATEGAKTLATQLVKQSFSAAEQTLKAGMAPARKAASMAGGVAAKVAGRGAAPAGTASPPAPAKASKAPRKRAKAARKAAKTPD
jgi:hypothetical protein